MAFRGTKRMAVLLGLDIPAYGINAFTTSVYIAWLYLGGPKAFIGGKCFLFSDTGSWSKPAFNP